MTLTATLKWLTTIAAVLLSGLAEAQSTGALDAKNGFRDAKFGMPLSSFKGMVKGVFYKPNEESNSYSRPSDALRIGDIKLKSIDYTFYLGRLSAINIAPEGEDDTALLYTFINLYGQPRLIQKDDSFIYMMIKGGGGKMKKYVWSGKNVGMEYILDAKLPQDGSTIAGNVSIFSKIIHKEIEQKADAKAAKIRKQRANDL